MSGVRRGLRRIRYSESGFSLTEVIVASAILVTGLVSVAQLFAASTDANRAARRMSLATIVAQQKIEQLRGLTWGFDALGLPMSDYTSNLTVTPAAPTGGTGLGLSTVATLDADTPGFVDYLGPRGEYLGTGAAPPVGTIYVRRWAIDALPTNPNNTLVFQVRVLRVPPSGATATAAPREDVRLCSVKTRKAT
jgi:prepilin-type N-terminal cleavage/methylation domain-containing protein